MPGTTPFEAAELSSQFAVNGFIFPIEVLSAADALSYRTQLESLERRIEGSKLGNKDQLNYPHVIFRFANSIIRSPRILDVVENLIGPNIMVWGSTFFIKEPNSQSYVSWHQDLRYWGLDSEAVVSAWLALSPVTKENGCMRFVPGSHTGGLIEHSDTFDQANFLTRGQEAVAAIDEQKVIYVELKPGQASFHHGKLLHASSQNRSGERRIGLAINYIAPSVRQTVARTDFAMLVRGKDRFGHFQNIPSPQDDLSDDAIAWHERILRAQNEAMYAGAHSQA